MNKTNKYRDLSKNTLLFTISSFGTKIISFFFLRLYTYILSKDDYGNIDIVSTTVQLLIPLLTLNIQDAVLRFSLDKDSRAEDVIGAGIKVIAYSSVFLGIVLLIVNRIGLFNLDGQYYLFLFLSYIFGVVYNCLSMYLKAKNRVYILTICGLINALLTCCLNLLLLLVVRMGVTGYLISNVVGTIVAVLVAFFFGKVWKEIRFNNTHTVLVKMVFYSLPLVVGSVAWWFNNASDRYILTVFCGIEDDGVYAVAYRIPTVLATIQTIFYSAWSISAITEYDKDDTDGFLGNVYALYSTASFVGCSFLLIGNYPIAQFLYQGEFFEAWKYVPPLLVGTVFNGIALFEGCFFTAAKKTKDVSKTTIVGAVVNTVLNFALIPRIGALGAAIATLLGYLSIWATRTWAMRSVVHLKVKWKGQFLTICLLLIQSIVALFQGKEWIQIPIVVIILILQRNRFKGIIAFLKKRIKRYSS